MEAAYVEGADRGETPVFQHLSALADALRCRMLLAMERHELSVSELCTVLQLPQSTVSRHLKTLFDSGWVTSRREGTRHHYSLDVDGLDGAAKRLWPIAREQAAAASAAEQDERRLGSVLARRRSKSKAFFSSAADSWDRVRQDLFGPGFHLHALLALLDPTRVVGDLGCGTGEVSGLVAPHVARVVAVDSSSEMLVAARRRLKDYANVEVRRGDLEALPLTDRELDIAIVTLVLHHVAQPARALAEVARALTPGGRILLVDMTPHDRVEYRQQMGHVWLGFREDEVRTLLSDAGFTRLGVHQLPIHASAKGPALFAAVAEKGGAAEARATTQGRRVAPIAAANPRTRPARSGRAARRRPE